MRVLLLLLISATLCMAQEFQVLLPGDTHSLDKEKQIIEKILKDLDAALSVTQLDTLNRKGTLTMVKQQCASDSVKLIVSDISDDDIQVAFRGQAGKPALILNNYHGAPVFTGMYSLEENLNSNRISDLLKLLQEAKRPACFYQPDKESYAVWGTIQERLSTTGQKLVTKGVLNSDQELLSGMNLVKLRKYKPDFILIIADALYAEKALKTIKKTGLTDSMVIFYDLGTDPKLRPLLLEKGEGSLISHNGVSKFSDDHTIHRHYLKLQKELKQDELSLKAVVTAYAIKAYSECLKSGKQTDLDRGGFVASDLLLKRKHHKLLITLAPYTLSEVKSSAFRHFSGVSK